MAGGSIDTLVVLWCSRAAGFWRVATLPDFRPSMADGGSAIFHHAQRPLGRASFLQTPQPPPVCPSSVELRAILNMTVLGNCCGRILTTSRRN
jgi:hypothetical protein